MTHNFGYCVSKYLLNNYNIVIEDKLCCLLGSSIDLQLIKRSNGFEVQKATNVTDLSQFYIESTNPLSLENFCTCINSVLRYEHNNDFNDLKWIISDYHNLGKIKTLILLSSSVLNQNYVNAHHAVYAIAYPIDFEPVDYSNQALKESEISIEIAKNVSLTITGANLEKFWNIHGSDIFNANRYVIIPPVYSDFDKSLPDLMQNALTRQYLHLMSKGDFVGPKLMISLKNHLNNDSNMENRRSHRDLLLYSIAKNGGLVLDMNRRYIAEAFKDLYQKKIISSTRLTKALMQSSRTWCKAYSELVCNKLPKVNLLQSIYNDIYICEMKVMQLLQENIF